MKPNDLFDKHTDADIACVELTEKIDRLKSELAKAESELVLANAIYVEAYQRVESLCA
jgi:hypothetical protein